MIHEDSDMIQQIQSKPFSAAHAQRIKLNNPMEKKNDVLSDYRGAGSSKQSTNFTGMKNG